MARDGSDTWGGGEATGWPGDGDAMILAPPPLVSVDDLVGMRVINPHRQCLGRLANLAIDAEEGTVAYAVVAVTVDGAEKRFVAPWSALRHDPSRNCLVWRVERQALERSPGLATEHTLLDEPDADVWPRLPDDGSRRSRLAR